MHVLGPIIESPSLTLFYLGELEKGIIGLLLRLFFGSIQEPRIDDLIWLDRGQIS